jgi:hypothetical protein
VRDSAKLLLVSLRVQAFAAYDSGRLVRWGPVSSGRKAMPTPVGLYHTNWKDERRVSTFDEEWLLLWYMNLHNFQGVSLHQYELPGRPASHSCLRLLEVDARWLYAWCEQWTLAPDHRTIVKHGTPVVVFGEWRWGRRAPWKRLPEHPDACALAPEEIEDALRVMTAGVVPVFPAIADSTAARPGGLAPADSSRAPSDSARVSPAAPDTTQRR